MPGICAAVKATTRYDGSPRKTVLKSWKSRPPAPMMMTLRMSDMARCPLHLFLDVQVSFWVHQLRVPLGRLVLQPHVDRDAGEREQHAPGGVAVAGAEDRPEGVGDGQGSGAHLDAEPTRVALAVADQQLHPGRCAVQV